MRNIISLLRAVAVGEGRESIIWKNLITRVIKSEGGEEQRGSAELPRVKFFAEVWGTS